MGKSNDVEKDDNIQTSDIGTEDVDPQKKKNLLKRAEENKLYILLVIFVALFIPITGYFKEFLINFLDWTERDAFRFSFITCSTALILFGFYAAYKKKKYLQIFISISCILLATLTIVIYKCWKTNDWKGIWEIQKNDDKEILIIYERGDSLSGFYTTHLNEYLRLEGEIKNSNYKGDWISLSDSSGGTFDFTIINLNTFEGDFYSNNKKVRSKIKGEKYTDPSEIQKLLYEINKRKQKSIPKSDIEDSKIPTNPPNVKESKKEEAEEPKDTDPDDEDVQLENEFILIGKSENGKWTYTNFANRITKGTKVNIDSFPKELNPQFDRIRLYKSKKIEPNIQVYDGEKPLIVIEITPVTKSNNIEYWGKLKMKK